jgi:hypothetical protein
MKCPFCEAEISNTARKCRHCGEWIDTVGHQAPKSGNRIPDAAVAPLQTDKTKIPEEGSIVFAVITLVLYLLIYPIGLVLNLVGLFTGPRRGCFVTMLLVLCILPIGAVIAIIAGGTTIGIAIVDNEITKIKEFVGIRPNVFHVREYPAPSPGAFRTVPQIPPSQTATGLIANWPLAGNGADLSGNQLNLAMEGVRPIEDRFGRPNSALEFDGNRGQLYAADSPALQPSYITIAFWYLLESTGGQDVHPVFIDRTNAYSADGYRVAIEGNRQLLHFDVLNSTWTECYVPNILDTGTWHFLTATYDGAQLLVYQDARLVGRANGYGPIRYLQNTPLGIGRRQTGTSQMLNGRLSNIRMFNRALNPDEISALMNRR